MRSLTAALLLASCLLACGRREHGRVFVLAFDGLDPQTVDLLLSEGRLPNFTRLREHGGYGRLESERPLLSPIVWTTIATGRSPADHGITHFTARDPAGDELPVTSDLRRTAALWTIASAAGRCVASVGWWATWPPEIVRGTMVSDHLAYHFLFEDGFAPTTEGTPKVYPPELESAVLPLLVRPATLTAADLRRFADLSDAELSRPFDLKDELSHLRWAIAAAHTHRDIGLDLWHRQRPDLELLYVEATDSTAHLFGHLFRAAGLAGELLEQQRRYGRVVEEMYGFADEILGQVLAAIDSDTTLVVLSDHGFELGALHDDPAVTRDMKRVSERFHRPQGVLYLFGRGVRPRSRVDGASIYDVAPTVLALLGLPASEEMPGRVLVPLLHQIPVPERIASWESGELPSGGSARDPVVDQAELARLRALGYLGSEPAEPEHRSTAKGDRNLAAIEFQAGRYREAGEIFRRLLEEDPDDASLHTSLAGVYGALGRYAEAAREIDAALSIDPLDAEAHHNRGALLERQGEVERAIAAYREGLRYAPSYEPTRRALERLTGAAETPRAAARTAAERQALRLADEAARAARHGDYPGALARLDRAAALAPHLALLYQYRSNVQYLAGDVAGAIESLQRGLELEPDNALFATNLERLEADRQREE